jgi:hypothetical protein
MAAFNVDAETPRRTVPEELITRLKGGGAVPLVGAGLSSASGIATWHQLVNRLRESVGARLGRRVEVSELDLLQTPLLYSHMQGSRQPLFELLQEAIEGYEPNELHRLLAQMPVRSVLTTNWDQLIETAFKPLRPVHVIHDESSTAGWNEESASQIIKLHGTITDPKSIIFGEDDYQRFYTGQSSLLNLTKALLATRSVFAIGFSMTDTYVKMLFSEVSRLAGPSHNPHYVILGESSLTDLQTEALRAAGFIAVPVPTSKDDPYGVAGFLKALHRETYSWAVDRVDRTRMLLRETRQLKDYLGPDRTIRIRATMGPLAAPEDPNVFGEPEQGRAERELRELCLTLAREHGAKIRFIGQPLNRDFVLAKGYGIDAYKLRLAAFAEAVEELGENLEFAPTVRPTDANTWIVSNRAMIDSHKSNPEDHRLYDHAALERDGERVVQAIRWFDEEFENLRALHSDAGGDRERLLNDARKMLGGEGT